MGLNPPASIGSMVSERRNIDVYVFVTASVPVAFWVKESAEVKLLYQ